MGRDLTPRQTMLLRCGLGAIPVLMLLAGAPFANRLDPRIAGLPFLFAWNLLWVASIPLFLLAADRLRRRA
jgi:hypothetical protein